ncbi:MBL fold metallo-hydrolase [Brachybacterium sp. MASK1Z-5]|uniref:MBL fold metallo-hydrolase n=1 Tax=Brachybacterium halotolerans TaxID=2795215 RepID=A0ABS1BCV9_9MICO|nr:MBL fold metallo-hydrolase [Brachybacterium halotolerans]MBK0332488.1 MBL fold metallo-hydrolase [Brachybacterium halotolerans]
MEDDVPAGAQDDFQRDPDAPPVALELIRADNPGPMTLQGTNTYVLRDGEESWVVDPGPLDAQHLAAIIRACGSRPVGVLVTHRHADHTDGAGTLRRQLQNRTGCEVALWAADTRAVAGSRKPPASLISEAGVVGHVIHLPGHTVDSLGLLVDGGRMLTGDTLLGDGSSTVISPPDGSLTEHMQSLAILRALAIDGRISSLHPGHGSPATDPLEAIDAIEAMISHREERIAQVKEARAAGALSMDRLLRAVYGEGLDPALRGAAEDSLRAILDHIARTR